VIAVKKVKFSSKQPEVEKREMVEFLKEVDIISGLRHENILSFTGLCLKPACLLAEFMPRGSVWSLIHSKTRRRRLGFELKWKIAADTSEGMEYLHGVNIMHRELKPHNLLLGESWNTKVADFGLARTKVATTMTKVGTPRWVAPEVLRDERYSEKADVYSFGVILWELETEEVPFGEKTPVMQVITAVAYQRKTLPIPTVSPFAQLIKDCIMDSPNHRPSFTTILERLNSIKSLTKV